MCFLAALKECCPSVSQVSVAALPGSPWGHPALSTHPRCETTTPPQTRNLHMGLSQYFTQG